MRVRRYLLAIAAFIGVGFGLSTPAAAHPGGGGGGFHGGGGGGIRSGGGFHGHGGLSAGGYRGAFHGRGSYGYGRGGYGYGYGYRHGRYGGGFYTGLGYGFFLGALPWYYDTYLWDGVPYYYADDTYYTWNDDADAYETVRPPPGLEAEVKVQQPVVNQLFVYPKAGQSAEQETRDRAECHRWAATQSGVDPNPRADSSHDADEAPPGPKSTTPAPETGTITPAQRAEFLRADGACLEGRNYSVN